ncbi:6-phosphogluconolactonase [Treponema socranskii]|uniref:6-phosphogluconolactonase n=1 Tax=Treponema socranskii TaxID=53419 RepID=UPI0028F03442|nr:6-phosphogluconolactonase [Treponema socranskii]
MKRLRFDEVELFVYDTREEMGKAAARDAAACIKELLKERSELNCIFAAAPSQNDFLAALTADASVPWEKINAYHMDDYVGLKQGDPHSFNGFLSEKLFSKVPFKSVNLIDGEADPDKEAARYGALLDGVRIHITFMGIGENGHIAFNDPGVADFKDAKTVKKVKLDPICRQQQVNDGCFPTIVDVPEYALTVTIPTLVSSEHIFCIVPTAKKHDATCAALTGPVSETCPASILRKTKHTRMYIDTACAGNLINK